MPERIEALSWDSDFFEKTIGQVDLDGATPETLEEIVAEARDRRFDCVYGTHTPGGTHTSAHAQDAGFRLVEVNQLMKRPAGPFTPYRLGDDTVRPATEEDLAEIGDSLDLLAPWSRFGADPKFGQDAARRLHRAWVERAMRDPDRLATISEDEHGITGVGTHVRSPVHRIDLLAVLRPGTGTAEAHLGALITWAGDGVTEGGPCAARNIAPLRFLEHAGYALSKVTYTHHWWAP